MKLRFVFFVMLITALIFSSSCRRKLKGREEIVPIPTPVLIPNSPAIIVDNEVDYITDIAKNQIDGDGYEDICGAKVDTIQTNPILIVSLTFNKSIICNSDRYKVRRSGKIIVERLGSSLWSSVNAKIKLNFKDFKVFLSCDTCGNNNLLVKIDGIMTRVNVSGGDADRIDIGEKINYKLFASNLTYTYADSCKRIQNINQLISYTKNELSTVVSITGDTTINNQSKVGIWGKLWGGKDFTVVFKQPKVYQICGAKGKTISGEVLIQKGNIQTQEIYGTDLKGEVKNDCTAEAMLAITINANGTELREIFPY